MAEQPAMTRRRRIILVVLLLVVAAILVVPYVASRINGQRHAVNVRTVGAVKQTDRHPITNSLSVVCFNIAHGRGLAESNWDGGDAEQRLSRLNEIAATLAEIDADIVVLNEVDFDATWSNRLNQATHLAERAGYRFVAEQTNVDVRALHYRWRFGNAVLSKYPISHVELIDYPHYVAWEAALAGKKRGLLCEIDVPDQPMRLIAAHLSHRSELIRTQSAKMIISLTDDDPRPTLVAGDFNSTPSGLPGSVQDGSVGNAIDLLDGSGQFKRRPIEPSQRELFTFPANDPRTVIDWILVPPEWQFQNYKVLPTGLSDHRPVTATVTW